MSSEKTNATPQVTAHSFIRSRHPYPIYTAWCLLLTRQGERVSSVYCTCDEQQEDERHDDTHDNTAAA